MKTIKQKLRVANIKLRRMWRSFLRSPKHSLNKLIPKKMWQRVAALTGVFIIGASLLVTVLSPRIEETPYEISGQARQVISEQTPELKEFLVQTESGDFIYNEHYAPSTGSGLQGNQTGQPRFNASIKRTGGGEVTITDPHTNISVSMKPKFKLGVARQEENQLVYPIADLDGYLVYTARVTSLKEDILLNSYDKDSISFEYELNLPDGLEARIERDGSIGIYGSSLPINGNVSTGSEEDAALLEKARKNSTKDKLIFTIPAPYAVEYGRQESGLKMHFALENNSLYLSVEGLSRAMYPLSIDPSIYVETARKLMRGNNETNIDFDVSNELIQKGSTTGARFDQWTSTMDLPESRFDGNGVAAGGFLYYVGGSKGDGTQNTTTYTTPGTSTFNVPAGVTYVNVEMWGAGGGGGAGGTLGFGGAGGGGGYLRTTLTVTPSTTLNILVGGGGAGGNFATLSGSGGGGGGRSEITFSGTTLATAAGGGGGGGGDNTTSITGGTGGAGGDTANGNAGGSSGVAAGGGGATASAGGAAGTGGRNDGTAGAFKQGGAGADGRNNQGADGSTNNGGTGTGGHGGLADSNGTGNAGGGGGGSGYYGGGGGASSANNDAGGGGGGGGTSYSNGTGTSAQGGSGANPGNVNDPDRGTAGQGGTGGALNSAGTAGTAGKIVITYITGLANTTQKSVYWATLNEQTGALTTPNPGNGSCVDWCTNTAYDLPEGRRAHSVVAYNGYLYVIGGLNPAGVRSNHVYIAKIGANGEPSLWHPTDTNKTNWVYWYRATSTDLTNERSYHSAFAYNNRLYVMGGTTNAATGGVATVQYAELRPNGTFSSWSGTGMQSLPSVRHRFSAHVYNDYIYLVGGNSNGTLQNTVHYSKLSNTGTMSAWQSANNFTSARSTHGGSYSTIYGGYLYVFGGCQAIDGNGYCTIINDTLQLASINADGSISAWGQMIGLTNPRFAYSLFSWRNNIYRVGGCTTQNESGLCTTALTSTAYGTINDDGDASTVSITEISGSGNCVGADPYDCDLPPPGDGAGEVGNMLSASTILNGYIYVMGGCTDYNCSGNTPANSDASGNTAYAVFASDGTIRRVSTCPGTWYGSWCVDNSNRINSNTGTAGSGVVAFGGSLYIVGGLTGGGNHGNIYRNTPNANGTLGGAWTVQTLASVGAPNIAFTYAYARANPTSASTNPGNLYIFGGCDATLDVTCTGTYRTDVYKCNIQTSGAIAGCTTTGQLQIDSDTVTAGNQGIGGHSGAVYANYIYLVGGRNITQGDKSSVMYAKFDNNNNVVAVSGGTWIHSPNTLSIPRQLGYTFGYNGHLYSLGGYESGGQIVGDIEFAKIDVSDGSIGTFGTSAVTINQRWGLTMVASNSWAYVIGGCDVGIGPASCSSFERSLQVFQIYNNESGSPVGYAADDLFTTDRMGASSAIHNGYIYVAGGCVSTTDCTDSTNSVQYAPLSEYGDVGAWSAGGNLPADRAWGSLEVAGGTLYYIGGQDDTATNEQSSVYYTTSITSGNPSWGTATNGLPQARTKFGSAVWNNRIYIVGGLDSNAAATATVYVSPQLSGGGDISSAWTTSTSFNVARSGLAVTAYSNNLYIFGGSTGSNYLNDSQFAKINADGTVTGWTYSASLPTVITDADAVAANGYMYLVGGRSTSTNCESNTLIAPISGNTSIITGNNPTGIGEWFETNKKYTGDRYGASASYKDGKLYLLGGACGSTLTYTGANRVVRTTLLSQPQVAKYSRFIDTDLDVSPTKWLINGVDNSIGAQWSLRYRSSTAANNSWGQETNFGNVTLGQPETYTPLDGGGLNTGTARYYYFNVSVDSSAAYGYPDDITRGPTITDLSLFFTTDPGRRLRHGKSFTGGEQQPIDTPF